MEYLLFEETDEIILEPRLSQILVFLKVLNQYVLAFSNYKITKIAVETKQLLEEEEERRISLRGIFEFLLPSNCKEWKGTHPTELLQVNSELSRAIRFRPSYARVKTPFTRFNAETQNHTLTFIYKSQDDSWTQVTSDSSVLQRAMALKTYEDRKALLISEGNQDDVLKFGENMLKNIEALRDSDLDPNEKPLGLPKWTARRIEELEAFHPVMKQEELRILEVKHNSLWKELLNVRHNPLLCEENDRCENCYSGPRNLEDEEEECIDPGSCDQCKKFRTYKDTGNCGLPRCNDCHEYQCLTVLSWWYKSIFEERRKEIDIIMADETTEKMKARLKTIVVKGERETGKTKWFECIVPRKSKRQRVIHVKGKFHKDQFPKYDEAWFILIDDFTFVESEDLQCLKAITAGEETVISAKWFHHIYEAGLPCVILCNEDKLFWYLYNSSSFNTQCAFIDLESLYIGPPSTVNAVRSRKENIPVAIRPHKLDENKLLVEKKRIAKESETLRKRNWTDSPLNEDHFNTAKKQGTSRFVLSHML